MSIWKAAFELSALLGPEETSPPPPHLPPLIFLKKNPPEGVNYQWAPKGSYQIEQILDIIRQLPNIFNMFKEKGYVVYVLDDYSVYLMT